MKAAPESENRERADSEASGHLGSPGEGERTQPRGWLEGDTVHRAGPDGGAIVTLIDRKSRYLLMRKVNDLKSAPVRRRRERCSRRSCAMCGT